MRDRHNLLAAVVVLAAALGVAQPAAAGARLTVAIGQDCCWDSPDQRYSPHHNHHHQRHNDYPGWGAPVYVVPPPVVYYERPPIVYYECPPVVYYERPPVVYYERPPIVYAPPPVVYSPPPQTLYEGQSARGVEASPASPFFTDAIGRSCREYQSSITVGGVVRPTFGTACQQTDGAWRIVR